MQLKLDGFFLKKAKFVIYNGLNILSNMILSKLIAFLQYITIMISIKDRLKISFKIIKLKDIQ